MAKNLRLRSAEERVGCYLLALFQRDDRTIPLRLPIDKKEIASQLGMSREVFSRALSGMEEFGMRVVGKVLEVDDAAAAKARFAFDPLIDGNEPIVPLQARRTRP
jgi:CRP/FNR family transcriptional activator FtrB